MNFIIDFLLFSFAVIFLMLMPAEGIFSFGSIPYSGWRRVTLGLTVGIVLMIGLAYGFGMAGFRIGGPITLAVFDVIAFLRWKRWWKKIQTGWEAPHVLLLIFAFVFSLSVVTSGWIVPNGLLLRSVNGQDGIWNIALARELKENFPPQHPSIAGAPLKGYHIFYNLWIGEIARIVPISILNLHYHFAAILMSLLFVYGIYALAEALCRKKSLALWGTFFAIFGGSFSFILPYIYHRPLSFDDSFGITQPISLLLSPSVTLSIVVLIWTYLLLCEFIHRKSWLIGLLIVLLSGVSVGIKVYAGVIVMGTLSFICLYDGVFKKQWVMLLILILSGIVSALVFFPLNASYGFLIFEFLWPPNRVMQGTLNFTNWELKRQTLLAIGSVKGVLKLEFEAVVFFLLGNIGTRIIGFFGFIPFPKKFNTLTWAILLTLCISFIMPMLFIQPIGAYNMIQFFWYFMVFIGILCGIGIGRIVEKLSKTVAVIAAVIIILGTLPSAIWKLNFIMNDDRIPVSKAHLVFYTELASIGSYSDVVLELPKMQKYSAAEFTSWAKYISLPYVPAFAGKRIFLGGEVVQFRYDELWKNRLPIAESFMSAQFSVASLARTRSLAALDMLYRTYHVRYILTENQPVWFDGDNHFRKIVTTSGGAIYQIMY
ncbi:MAG TPA: hypothetical protein VMR81_07115 [Patescibacteria group bacterium]|nr:hypothetical protein [Patescibacteria group bacterium]